MSFGSTLKERREQKRISQIRLAVALGVTKATVSAWENDKKMPESFRLPAIKETLGVSIDDLFAPIARAKHRIEEHLTAYGEPSLTDQEAELLALFRQASKARRDGVLALLAPEG